MLRLRGNGFPEPSSISWRDKHKERNKQDNRGACYVHHIMPVEQRAVGERGRCALAHRATAGYVSTESAFGKWQIRLHTSDQTCFNP